MNSSFVESWNEVNFSSSFLFPLVPDHTDGLEFVSSGTSTRNRTISSNAPPENRREISSVRSLSQSRLSLSSLPLYE